MTVANRLLDTGNYGRQRIQTVAGRLEHDWKLFTQALETRSSVLALSVSFHYKANSVSDRKDYDDNQSCFSICRMSTNGRDDALSRRRRDSRRVAMLSHSKRQYISINS